MSRGKKGAEKTSKLRHSDIVYHDYMAMLCFMDAEWTRDRISKEKVGKDYTCLLRNRREFGRQCKQLKDGINTQYENWYVANEGVTPTNGYVKPEILNPIFYTPFGHADDMAIVLLDDLDPLHYLTSNMRKTVEEVCVAFCPKVESYVEESEKSIFCGLDSLMPPQNSEYKKEPKSLGDTRKKWEEQRLPLLVFSKLKMDGLATVGYSLSFEQAVFRAIAKKIIWAVNFLKKGTDCVIEAQDLESCRLRCTILDLQGSEEVGLLIWCQNYSVGMSLTEAVRTITFGDVYKAEGGNSHLTDILRTSKVHTSAIRLAQKAIGDPVAKTASEAVDAFAGNHVFRWSHSYLSVIPEALFEPKKFSCNGFVEALDEVQIAPGHREEAEDLLNKNSDTNCKEKIDITNYHRFLIGTGDILVSPCCGAQTSSTPVVRLKDALRFFKKNVLSFGVTEPRTRDHGRAVIDISTSISIPVRRLGIPIDKERHLPVLCEVLPQLVDRLCGLKEVEKTKECLDSRGKLDISQLDAGLRKCGIPYSLRLTIKYLYQNYSIVLRDPFLFDNVLGLYDTLATFHAVISKHLVQLLEEQETSYLDQTRVKQLSAMVEALHNKLTHLMLRAYPEVPIREMAIDFRGGLNQILFAADAPVKCGLGILRKFIYDPLRQSRQSSAKHVNGGKNSSRDSVGGLIRIGFTPGATCFSLKLNTEKSAKLAFFDADVPHVLHIASYFDNFHETFHLIFDSLCAIDDHPVGRPISISDASTSERASEIFSHLLSLILIFGVDIEQFLYFQICTFSKSLEHIGKDNTWMVARCTEVLTRLFIATEIVSRAKTGEVHNPLNHSVPMMDYSDDIGDRFINTVDEYHCFLSGFKDFWADRLDNGVEQFCRDQIKEINTRLLEYLPDIWENAYQVFDYFRRNEGFFVTDTPQFEKEIAKNLGEGRPIIRNAVESPIAPLLLICSILRCYSPKGKEQLNKLKGRRMHINRKGDRREISFERVGDGGKKWNDFLIDTGWSSTFVPVPYSRRERLRKQIAVLKSLWDISSNLRGRRFWEMLRDNWPERELLGEIEL